MQQLHLWLSIVFNACKLGVMRQARTSLSASTAWTRLLARKKRTARGPPWGQTGGPPHARGDRRGDAGAPRKPGAGGEEEEEEDGEREDEEEAGFEDDDDYLQVLLCFHAAFYLARMYKCPL